jgi:transcriptional regulator with XRE-family HTH domain
LEQRGTSREQLASLLKQARLAAGYDSHSKLAKAMLLSRSVVAKAESGNQAVPSDPVLAAWAKATGADLAELIELAQRVRNGTPEWFMDYRIAEQAATRLWFWGPLAVPGVLQTQNYARALLSDLPRTAEQLQALVDQRMERQQVITRTTITAIIDHAVLQRCIGSPAIMAEQCGHLATLVEERAVSLHVVPEGGNIALTAAFAIAIRGSAATVSMTASSRDITSTAPDVVEENMGLFSVILRASLPVVQTLEFVRRMEEIWKER